MTLRTGRRPNRGAFTLIELVLLTVIIAVLVSISTPLFRKTYSSLSLREASYNLAKLISFIQERAVLETTKFKLTIDSEDSRYYLAKERDETPDRYERLSGKLGRVFKLPAHIKIAATKRSIVFYPDGRSDKTVITLSSKTKRVKMKVTGRLGNVEIDEGGSR